MMTCLFCSIIKKDVPAEVIYEDEQTLALLDIQPMAPGHALVVPKTHAETILDLKEAELTWLFKAVVESERRMLKALKPDGFTIGINQREAAGQEVAHLHVHVVPRFREDGGSPIQKVVHNPPTLALKEMAQKIRNG